MATWNSEVDHHHTVTYKITTREHNNVVDNITIISGWTWKPWDWMRSIRYCADRPRVSFKKVFNPSYNMIYQKVWARQSGSPWRPSYEISTTAFVDGEIVPLPSLMDLQTTRFHSLCKILCNSSCCEYTNIFPFFLFYYLWSQLLSWYIFDLFI